MPSQGADEDLGRLFDAVLAAEATDGVRAPHVVAALYRLLGFGGEPVSVTRLAAAVDADERSIHQTLERLPNVEWDEAGAVVGFGGLSLRPTPHRLLVAGRVRHTWCAWDTLFLPVVLDSSVEVRSRCPVTGQPVGLTVTPTGIAERAPDSIVLSFVHPGAVDRTDLRRTFCQAVHFLADPSIGEDWESRTDDALILDVREGFELGRRMIMQRCGPALGATRPGRQRA